MNPFAAHPEQISKAFRIIRDRQQKYGEVVVPRKLRCPCCNNLRDISSMPTIPHTGIVGPVVDCLCRQCTKENEAEFRRLVRVVCAGCREVVAVVSPGKEKTGFVWQSGRCVHVAECPACTSKKGLVESPIAEKLAFYKRNGIPYA